jgi:predicted dehydrogenase
MDTARLGLVGLGWFGGVLAESARSSGAAEVVACYARTEITRAAFAEKHGCRAVADLDEMLADPGIDGVVVATPHSTHADIAVRMAEAGKHVFVEKPLATTLDEARAALAAAERAEVRVSIDYVLRHHPLHRLAIELTRSEAFGTLRHFALENFASSESLPPDHWFWDPALSGGIHVEHGVHFFDLCLALAGREPDQVSGATQVRSDGRADRASALIRFGHAMIATFYHSFNRTAATERTTIRLAFERGHASLEGWIPTRLEVDGTANPERFEKVRTLLGSAAGGRSPEIAAVVERPDRQDDYRLAIQAGMSNLIGAVLRNEPLEVSAEDGLRSLEVALRASDRSREPSLRTQ